MEKKQDSTPGCRVSGTRGEGGMPVNRRHRRDGDASCAFCASCGAWAVSEACDGGRGSGRRNNSHSQHPSRSAWLRMMEAGHRKPGLR